MNKALRLLFLHRLKPKMEGTTTESKTKHVTRLPQVTSCVIHLLLMSTQKPVQQIKLHKLHSGNHLSLGNIEIINLLLCAFDLSQHEIYECSLHTFKRIGEIHWMFYSVINFVISHLSNHLGCFSLMRFIFFYKLLGWAATQKFIYIFTLIVIF